MTTLLQQASLEECTPDYTPFSRLLSSFAIPTNTEAIALKAAIQETSEQERRTEGILPQLNDVMKNRLEATLGVYRKFKCDLQAMLSSLRLLPPELLSDIFLMCLPKDATSFTIRSPPWTMARVCRKWRQVTHLTPSLWVHTPQIRLAYNQKPGFFELFRTVLELSFPLTVSVRFSGINRKKFEDFAEILPRVHSLSIDIDASILEALVQRKESFKSLKSANVSLYVRGQTSHSLEFLSKVSDLTLRLSWDVAPFLRSVETQWPNLTTFHGDEVPSGYLPCLLSSAPLLRKVTMFNMTDDPFSPSTSSTHPSAPSPSVIRHTNLKELRFVSYFTRAFPTLWIHQTIQLPALRLLHVEHKKVLPPLFSLLQHTQGSIVKLYLEEPSRRHRHHRAFYSFFPRLEELTLCSYSGLVNDFEALTISTDLTYMPCPALRHLHLKSFTCTNYDDSHTLQDFLSSRGLVPVGTPLPHFHRDYRHQLNSVTVSFDSSDKLQFYHYVLRSDNDTLSTVDHFRRAVQVPSPKLHLEKLKAAILSWQSPSFLLLLDDYGIIENVKQCAAESQDIRVRDAAQMAYEAWMLRSEESQGRPPQWQRLRAPEGFSEYILERT